MTAPTAFWPYGRPQLALYTTQTDYGPFSDPLNAIDLSITHSGDDKAIPSTEPGSLGQALDPILYLPKPTKISFKLNHKDKMVFAAFMLAQNQTYSQDAATATSNTVTLSQEGWAQLKNTDGTPARNVVNVAITGKILGTDFAVLPDMGMVKALTSGAATSSTITFDTTAIAGTRVLAGKNTSLSFALQMRVEDNAGGPAHVLEIPKITVLPGSANKLVSMDNSEFDFSGTIVKTAGHEIYTLTPLS